MLGNILSTPQRDKHFWRRFRGVASILVDPKRATGNFQLHCKFGKSSSFY